MKYPLHSTLLSFLVWVILLFLVGFFYATKIPKFPEPIQMDADLVTQESSESHPEKVQTTQTKDQDKLEVEKPEKKAEPKTKITQQTKQNNDNKTGPKISYRSLPKIPDDLRREAFNSFAIARFHIKSDGSFTVELIQPCSNPKLNHLLLESLKQWKFDPAQNFGSAIDSVKDVKISFKVE